jgi:tungstate transport system ATP-binding protein
MNTALYQIQQLEYRYADKRVLRIDELTIEKGSSIGLMGANGSGKSTLLSLLGFVRAPSSGIIQFNGHPALPFSKVVRFRVALLPQEPFLMNRSVFANVAYGLKLRGMRKDLEQCVFEALEMVGLDPDAFARRDWHALSGGEAQRVALAARLVLQPEVLLMDEPTASVDVASEALIRKAALRARQEWGTTLVIASHDREWLYQVADRVLFIHAGRLVQSSRYNLILGPWQPDGSQAGFRQLSDGQRFAVPTPPDYHAAAVLPCEHITVTTALDPVTSQGVVLSARLINLTFDATDQQVLATAVVGDLTLTGRAAIAPPGQPGLFPGERVQLSYHLHNVRWLSERSGRH